MNQRPCIFALILCATCTVSLDSYAKAPIGGDDFNDDSLSQDWIVPPASPGHGALVDANGRLEYLASGADPSDNKFVLWNHYVDDPTLSWTYKIDVSMPSLALTGPQSVLFGLQLDGTNNAHAFSYLVQFVDSHSGATVRQIAASTASGTLAVPAISDIATVRLRYDAGSHTIFADYDADGPTGGFTFTNLASRAQFDPTDIFVVGQSSGGVILTSNSLVYGDDSQSAIVPEPSICGFAASGIGLLVWLVGRRRARAA